MTQPERIALSRADQTVELCPAVGGSIARYTIDVGGRTVDLLRPTHPTATRVLDFACFPLVPYSSRIREGRFRFEGRDIRLPLNFGDHPHSIHGHGWQSEWTVTGRETTSATLDYHHAADAWPWAYSARQRITLDEHGLLIELSLTNLSDARMPAGLGLHPYFPRARAAHLTASVSSVWRMDSEVMPVERVALPPDLPLPSGVSLADVVLDNGFEGWNGCAEIAWSTAGIGLVVSASPELGRLVVYAPAAMDFFCVEPVSHMTDAFNRAAKGDAATGMRVLGPHETFAAWMRLSPQSL